MKLQYFGHVVPGPAKSRNLRNPRNPPPTSRNPHAKKRSGFR